jgi:putative transposase
MESDRRQRPAPAAYCFTVVLLEEWYGALTEHVDTLRLAFRACRDRYPFIMNAGVVLPDHMHCILTFASDDTAREVRWRLIKGLFERVCGGGREMWAVGHDEAPLAGEADVACAADRIHSDPVRHGLVRRPKDWPYSSFHAYVAHGLRTPYWHEQIDDGAVPACSRRAA